MKNDQYFKIFTQRVYYPQIKYPKKLQAYKQRNNSKAHRGRAAISTHINLNR